MFDRWTAVSLVEKQMINCNSLVVNSKNLDLTYIWSTSKIGNFGIFASSFIPTEMVNNHATPKP